MWVWLSNLGKFIFRPPGSMSVGGAGIVMAMFMILPCLMVPYYINFCSFKNQVIIEETICEGVSITEDGDEAVTFSIQTSFKKRPASEFDVHTLVFKGEEFRGYLHTTFDGGEPNTTQDLPFYILTDGSLGKELASADLGDYTFVSEVRCVYFGYPIESGWMDPSYVGYSSSYYEYYYDENGEIHYTKI